MFYSFKLSLQIISYFLKLSLQIMSYFLNSLYVFAFVSCLIANIPF